MVRAAHATDSVPQTRNPPPDNTPDDATLAIKEKGLSRSVQVSAVAGTLAEQQGAGAHAPAAPSGNGTSSSDTSATPPRSRTPSASTISTAEGAQGGHYTPVRIGGRDARPVFNFHVDASEEGALHGEGIYLQCVRCNKSSAVHNFA